MIPFIIRRIVYSLLIVLGVVILTFVMFNLAAGDPAAAVLGKNPRPAEVEALRRELGADLPILFGRRCRTEVFGGATFDGGALPPGVTLTPETGGAPGAAVFAPRFAASGVFELEFALDGRVESVENGELTGARNVIVADPALPVTLHFRGTLAEAKFHRLQRSPFHSQFRRALGEIVSTAPTFPYVRFLDFGRAISTREPIGRILARGVGPSLGLMLPIFLGEIIFGVTLAMLAAAFKDRVVDRALVIASVAGMSVSYLVLIIFAQWFLGYYCNFFPVWGWGSWFYLVLPVIVGIVSGLGSNVRFYRTVFVDELKREYLRTAAAKGCSPFAVYAKHLLRNAAIPIITRATAALPFLFTGSLLLETFFGIPGLGFAGIDALNNSDLQLLKALVITSALLFVFLNLLADLAYAWADPRIRLE